MVKTDIEIGYLHRAFEKDCEDGPGQQRHPLHGPAQLRLAADQQLRLPSAVEKLLGIEITERCKYIRVIMSEISRICDHLTCVGASAMELGAFTVFLYMIKAREFLWELVEDVTGARLTISYGRVGGVKARPARRASAARCARRSPRRGRCSTKSHTLLTRQPHLHGPHGRHGGALRRGRRIA